MSNNTPTTHVDGSKPIHPIAVRQAFGGDAEHPAVVGRLIGLDGTSQIVTLPDSGRAAAVDIDDEAFTAALGRKDVCRYGGSFPLVLLNFHYGLIALAIGRKRAPTQLEVDPSTVRLENGSAVEIPRRKGQPGWLLFRCRGRVLPADADEQPGSQPSSGCATGAPPAATSAGTPQSPGFVEAVSRRYGLTEKEVLDYLDEFLGPLPD
jgi:hypothetical protein